MDRVLADFIQAVRGAEVRVSVAEALEAHEVVRLLGYGDRDALREGLGVTLAKTVDEKGRFFDTFDRYFTAEIFADAAHQEFLPGAEEAPGDAPGEDATLVERLLAGDRAGLMSALREAVREVGVSEMTLFTQRGIVMQRLMARMGLDRLDQELAQLERSGQGGSDRARRLREGRAYLIDQMKTFVQQQVALYTGASGQALREQALSERRLNKLEEEDAARMIELVQRLARRLARVHARRAKRAHRGQLDVRRTLRRNMGFDGNLFNIHWRRVRVDKPRVVVICDVSRSVADYTRFLLLFLHSLSEVMDRIRSFTFCADVVEVTDIFEHQPVATALDAAQAAAPIGPTDYGRTLAHLVERHLDAFTPRTTVLFLGDARNNLSDPRADLLKLIAQRSRHLIWLNPEPFVTWNTGDSIIATYKPLCHVVRECASLRQLESAVDEMLRLTTRAS